MIAAPARPTPEMRPFRPCGQMRGFAVDRRPECLLSGPAGTGKSRMCLEKMFRLANQWPQSRHLILRKTRESLSEAALQTWELEVVPPGHPMLEGAQRRMRQKYVLPNGSEVIVAGLDKPTKVMSTQYDLIYVQEATECEEHDWELCTTRLRNGRMPFAQLIADCNPDAPHHWLYQRCATGLTALYETRHEDNPVYWDERRGAPTERGADYLAKLDRLTGVRYKRLRLGLWVAAEGIVYEGWDPAVHRISQWAKESAKRFIAGVDWGFTNPGVILVFAEDGDGRLTCVEQVYQTRRTIDWWIEQAQGLKKRWGIQAFIADPSEPSYLKQFNGAQLFTVPAFNDVVPGIGAVAQRLVKAEDGQPRLFYLRDSLTERDADLTERKLPCGAEEERDGYVWNLTGGRKKGEEPVKANDHAMDAERYAVCYADGLGRGARPVAIAGAQRRAW